MYFILDQVIAEGVSALKPVSASLPPTGARVQAIERMIAIDCILLRHGFVYPGHGAIVCQETAYKWVKWIDEHDADTIIARCVFDASGDYPGTERSAFPVNTAAFRSEYGDQFADLLIDEANQTRRLQGWNDKPWVYKGYGIFQYDLQKVVDDEAFFRTKLWYSFDTCLARCCQELDEKLARSRGDLWKAIKAYNGSGARADQYASNVRVFSEYCAEVIDAT